MNRKSNDFMCKQVKNRRLFSAALVSVRKELMPGCEPIRTCMINFLWVRKDMNPGIRYIA